MQFQQIRLTVTYDPGRHVVSATGDIPKASEIVHSVVSEYDVVERRQEVDKLTWAYADLLPRHMHSSPLEALTSWHSLSGGSDVVVEFMHAFQDVFGCRWEKSGLARILAAATDVAEGTVHNGHAPVVMVVVDDRACIIPWERLVHTRGRKSQRPFPIVLRRLSTGVNTIARLFRSCHAHVGRVPAKRKSKVSGKSYFLALAEWAVGARDHPTGAQSVPKGMASLSAPWRGTVLGIPVRAATARDILWYLRTSHAADLHYVFAEAAQQDCLVLTKRVTISSSDLDIDESSSNAKICGIFPVSNHQHSHEAKPWLPLGMAAYNWCIKPVLSVTTLTPLTFDQSATIARGLTEAAAQASSSSAAHPLEVVAELFSILRGAKCYTELESVLMVGPPDIPTPSTMRAVFAEADRKLEETGGKMKVLLCTATKVEGEMMTELAKLRGCKLEALPGKRGTYLSLGEHGGVDVTWVQSQKASSGSGGALATTLDAIADLQPTFIISCGIGFGHSSAEQELGDVMVSEWVREYERQRVGAVIVPRGDRIPASPYLFQAVQNMSVLRRDIPVHMGGILSGDKLVDNPEFKASLWHMEPEAIGGDMEGAGIVSACYRCNIPWIVIKGICDWGENKDDKDQKLAARNAIGLVLDLVLSGGIVTRTA